MKDFDLRGKVYLTVAESAHCCGVSQSQFRDKAPRYGLIPRMFMGKLLYRKKDLQAAIENEWLRLDGAGRRGISKILRTR